MELMPTHHTQFHQQPRIVSHEAKFQEAEFTAQRLIVCRGQTSDKNLDQPAPRSLLSTEPGIQGLPTIGAEGNSSAIMPTWYCWSEGDSHSIDPITAG